MAHTKSLNILALLVISLLVGGCAQLLPPGLNMTPSESPTAAVPAEPAEPAEELIAEEVIAAPAEPVEATAAPVESLPRKIVTEGELVSFPNLQATDPDGDKITYTFTPPLDAVGKWQTKVGDAGEYRVTITASDGKNSVSQIVIIHVNMKNQPPRIQLAGKQINVKEGDTVTLKAQASDPDGDEVTLSFAGWMTSPTRTTGYSDAGVHEVEVIATDGTLTVRDAIQVVVQNTNRAPSINPIADVLIKEGDKIKIDPTASDPDGSKVTFSFSAPVAEDGAWQTAKQDVGKYRVNVTASDGDLTATTSFLLTVESLNNPPVIQLADLIRVDEGQTVKLSPTITDPEGDELTITYAGWMSSTTYTTTYEDAGSHLVTLTVSDGINTVKKDVTVMVTDVNRAPTFGSGAFN